MDYSMDAVANKMILVIIALSAVVSACGFGIFMYLSGNEDASIWWFRAIMGVNASATVRDGMPFIIGVGAAMGLNIAKVTLMKRAVNNALMRDKGQAKLYLQGQYFLRLVLTGAVLCVAGWMHGGMANEAGNPQYVNFMGTFFGIFTFPLSTYSMRFFLRNELKDNAFPEGSEKIKSVTESAIEELKAIGTETETKPETSETDSEKQ